MTLTLRRPNRFPASVSFAVRSNARGVGATAAEGIDRGDGAGLTGAGLAAVAGSREWARTRGDAAGIKVEASVTGAESRELDAPVHVRPTQLREDACDALNLARGRPDDAPLMVLEDHHSLRLALLPVAQGAKGPPPGNAYQSPSAPSVTCPGSSPPPLPKRSKPQPPNSCAR